MESTEIEKRTCKKCGNEKYVDEFHIVGGRRKPDGSHYRRGECMTCRTARECARIAGQSRSEYMKEYYKGNKEKWKADEESRSRKNALRRAKYNSDATHREHVKLQVKSYFINNPLAKKKQRILKYKMSLDDWNAMLASQDGKCLICGYSDTSDPKTFPVVDHCHTTGRVRGMLCSKCNTGIGYFDDNTQRMENAIRYLQKQA